MNITKDGEYAYIDMALPVAIFKVRLEDMVVEAVADLSAYFPGEGGSIALDTSEKKLFVTADAQRKLLVVDTQTMSVTYTINDIDIIGMTRSQYGPFLITWSGGGSVKFVNTETFEVTEFVDSNEFFLEIQESNSNQDLWYVISGHEPGLSEVNTGIYDHKSKTWNRKISLPSEARAGSVMDLEVLPNEHKVYVAVFGGWYPEYHAYGWLHSVDLVSGEVKVVPIDGGASCLEASPDGRWVYVGTDWPMPNTNNLLVVDTQTDEIVDQIYLGQTQYGWHYTQMDTLQIDPARPSLLYATNGDGNALVKMDLDNLTLVDVLVFNQESFRPHFFVRRPGKATGFIVICESPYTFELDLNQAAIKGVVKFPNIRQDAHVYDIGINDTGKLLIAQSEYILEVDAEDMHLLGTHPLPPDISVWYFILSNDQKMIYSIGGGPDGYLDTFLAINTSNFQVEASVWLEGGNFVYRPYELPDGSKLYALGGQQNGPVVIHVIDTETYTIQKTITFDEPGMLGISAGGSLPFAYDSNSHTLYVGATQVVLAIDTETDVIKKVIYLGDAARAIGLEPQQLTYFNATGMVYNPQENYLYIAHLDQSFVSIYDLTHDQFLPQVILLNGFFPSIMFASDDYSRMYIINTRSDNISVIDTNSKTEEKVIDLHAYGMPPESFNKNTPVDRAGSQPTSLTLNWAVSIGATSYEYCYDTTNDNACSSWVDNGTSTSMALNGLTPGTTYYWQVRANNVGGTTYANTNTWWSFTTLSNTATFGDVPISYWAREYIERLHSAGITGGCATSPSLMYCPDSTVTRAQMAVFLLKGMHGSSYTPPAVGANSGFTDVPIGYWAAAWIKQLSAEGITGGCGSGNYCPDSTVTRAQMAVFLLKAKHGTTYAPPAATGVFTDVPVGYWADKWVEQLAVEGITGGCGAGIYCPDSSVTRAQMAVFLVKTFNLP